MHEVSMQQGVSPPGVSPTWLLAGVVTALVDCSVADDGRVGAKGTCTPTAAHDSHLLVSTK
jgi:hypothetical protein